MPRLVTPAKAGVQSLAPQRAPKAAQALLDTRFRGYDTLHPSLLDEQRGGGLDQRAQALDESRGVIAVDHAMIER